MSSPLRKQKATEFNHDEKAFLERFPFPLTSTNLRGAYVAPILPDHFDPKQASQTKRGENALLWRRIVESEHPAFSKELEKFFDRKRMAKDHITPELEVQIGKRHILKKKPSRATDASWVGSQWAGAVFVGGSWNGVVGTWTIPTVSQPSEPQGTEGGWNSSSWLGIDGFNTATNVSNDVLQAGIEQSVDAKGQASYVAWYEWFAPPQFWSPGYIYQTNIGNFPVSPGQKIFCLVQYLPMLFIPGIGMIDAGYIILENETTGKVISLILWPPPGATFAGNSIEWIMEAPDGGLPTSSLPKFTPVRFTSAIGSTPYNTVGNPKFSDTVNVQNGAGTVLTSVTLGPESAEIDFIG
jgi:hypothetical protein